MTQNTAPRPLRADAQRNIDSLLDAAKSVFGTSGVDAPAKEIADLAGVGVGTLYRHFPKRSDLVKAVFQHEVDASADAAPAARRRSTSRSTPWRGGSTGTRSSSRPSAGSPPPCTRATLPSTRCPGTSSAASAPPSARCSTPPSRPARSAPSASPKDLLYAVSKLSLPMGNEEPDHGRRMIDLLMDGLQYGAGRSASGPRP